MVEVNFGPMFIVQMIVVMVIFIGAAIFFMKKMLFDTTTGAVNHLNREMEKVRAKQAELNEKLKLANEELTKRRAEADALVVKMKEEAETKAQAEREKIVKKAREDGEEIISKAQKTRDDIRKNLEKEMAMKAIDFTVLVLNEVLSSHSHEAFNESLVDEFIRNLEGLDMSMIDEGLTAAEITTAAPLDSRFKNKLSDLLKKKLNRDISINASVDAQIIAGVVLQFGSLKLDGSLRNMIKDKGLDIKDKIEKGVLKTAVISS